MFKKLKKHVQEHKAELSQSSAHVQSLQKQSLTRLAFFKRYRDVEYQEYLQKDFKHVLEAWGIHSEEERKSVIKSLYLRIIIITCVIVGIGVDIFYSSITFPPPPSSFLSHLYKIAFLLALYASVFAFLCTVWRIAILTTQAYRPMRQWLFGGF